VYEGKRTIYDVIAFVCALECHFQKAAQAIGWVGTTGWRVEACATTGRGRSSLGHTPLPTEYANRMIHFVHGVETYVDSIECFGPGQT
jgi:hypothetical protein